MKALNILTLILLIVGGLNWGLVGLFQYVLVAGLFGGSTTFLARLVYGLVGASALWQLIFVSQAMASDQPRGIHR
jgi:uncharacterized protein